MKDTSYTQSITAFVENDIKAYLADELAELQYPTSLLDKMKALGVFGLNIPINYGGIGLGFSESIDVTVELSRGWLSLPAMLGTHYRVCLYFQKCGSEEQQNTILPLMAKGKLIAAHAYHEKGIKETTEFQTSLTKKGEDYVLNGKKDWVTNAKNADAIVVIAKNNLPGAGGQPVAIITYPSRSGVVISSDLRRPGIKGISLCDVTFSDYKIDISTDLIGGIQADIQNFIDTNKIGSSVSFAARAVGAGIAVVSDCQQFIMSQPKRVPGQEVINFRFAQIATDLNATKSVLSETMKNIGQAPDPVSLAHMTKVFCSTTLQNIVRGAMMLKGGSSYASQDGGMERIYRDAVSLLLIDTPNDILLSRIGKSLLSTP